MPIFEKSTEPKLEYRVPFQKGDVWKIVSTDDIGIWLQPNRNRSTSFQSGFYRFANCTLWICVLDVKQMTETWREQFLSDANEESELVYNLTVLTDCGRVGLLTTAAGRNNWQLVSRYGL